MSVASAILRRMIVTAPVHQVTNARQVQANALLLELMAQWVSAGNDSEMSMLYPDALGVFGADSPHFQAACRGHLGAAEHYRRNGLTDQSI